MTESKSVVLPVRRNGNLVQITFVIFKKHLYFYKCLRQESNLRRYALQAYALPTELQRHVIKDCDRDRTYARRVAADSLSTWLHSQIISAERFELPFSVSETDVLPLDETEL